MIDRLGNKPQLRVLIGRAYRETGFLPESIEEFKGGARYRSSFPARSLLSRPDVFI